LDPALLRAFPTRRSSDLAGEVGVLVRDGDQTRDRAQCPRLGVGELALIVEVRGQEADGAAARGERNVRDESQIARRDGREPNAVDRKSTRLNSSHQINSY